jgi:hypothetical protein
VAKAYTYGGFLTAFLPIRDRQTAFAAARGSSWAAAYVAIWHLATGLGLGLSAGGAGSAQAIVGGFNLLFALAAAALGWLAWTRRPRWVAVVVLAWVVAKLAGFIVGFSVAGRVSWSALGIVLLAALYALAGVRGVWALRAPPASAEVFD